MTSIEPCELHTHVLKKTTLNLMTNSWKKRQRFRILKVFKHDSWFFPHEHCQVCCTGELVTLRLLKWIHESTLRLEDVKKLLCGVPDLDLRICTYSRLAFLLHPFFSRQTSH